MDYGAMNKAELESALKRLRSNLEDLEETINFDLMFTSAHISGGQVKRDEQSLRELQGEIARVEELLSMTESPAEPSGK